MDIKNKKFKITKTDAFDRLAGLSNGDVGKIVGDGELEHYVYVEMDKERERLTSARGMAANNKGWLISLDCIELL